MASLSKPEWVDPFTPRGTREATARILSGHNYRLFYNRATRLELISTYRELASLARLHSHNLDVWKSHIRQLLTTGNKEVQQMRQWLIGLTRKTATNLGLRTDDYVPFFEEMMADIESSVSSKSEIRETALLLWCGAATLTIRGSHKARIGKILERSIARAALTTIGLQENKNFRLNIEADQEVDRQTDAEVRTPRGAVRVEVGLIGEGNPEVIADKVGRMNRGSIILMDKIPAKSNAYRTAELRGVKLIQLRKNNAVEEMRVHLSTLQVPVTTIEIEIESVEQHVLQMPEEIFEADYLLELDTAVVKQ